MLAVKRSDGSTVSGAVVQMTRIRVLETLSADQLAVGTRVMVQGATNPDGTVTTTLIMGADVQGH